MIITTVLSIKMILKLKFLFINSLVVGLSSKEDYSLHFNNYEKLRVSIKSVYFLVILELSN